MSLSFQSRVRATADSLFQELDGEAVILGLGTEKYYGLNRVGTRMWTVLVESSSIEEAYRKLLDEYEVDGEVLRQDLIELVERLVAARIVEVLEGGDPC